jgi:hypothetical protein
MAIDLQRIGEAAMELMDELTEHCSEEAKLKSVVLCADVDDPHERGGGGFTWVPVVGDKAEAARVLATVGIVMLSELTDRPIWMDAAEWEFVQLLKKARESSASEPGEEKGEDDDDD